MASLYSCKTTKQFCKLDRISFQYKNYWLFSNEKTIWIAEQDIKSGSAITQEIAIPKSIFKKFVDAYILDQEGKSLTTSGKIKNARSKKNQKNS